MAHILEEAQKEMEKLQSLLVNSRETVFREPDRQLFEEYREDDEAVYFEQGIVER
jgi:hypothetical protein